MTTVADLMKVDLYAVLGVSSTATDKEITKAYRKSALKCHPDKNPDKKAHEEFKRLGKILELLCDPAKRAHYDQQWKAKKAAEERVRQLDSKRRKLRDDLDARERAHMEKQQNSTKSTKGGASERVEQLREEGLRLVQSENLQGLVIRAAQSALSNYVKAKWDAVQPEHATYTKDGIVAIFEKYGSVVNVKMIGKSTVIIQFGNRDAALHSLQELGHIENPLDLDLLDDNDVSLSDIRSDAKPVNSPNVSKQPQEDAGSSGQKRPSSDHSSFVNLEADILQRMMEAAAAQKQNKS